MPYFVRKTTQARTPPSMFRLPMRAEINLSAWGLFLGFVVSMTALWLTYQLGMAGREAAAVTIGGTAVGLARVFVCRHS